MNSSTSDGLVVRYLGKFDIWPLTSALLVAASLLSVTVLVYVTGGTKFVYPHLMYLPVILGAFFFGARGGLLSGLAAGFLIGPFMPLEVESGAMQYPASWLFRMSFFSLVGFCSGMLFSSSYREAKNARDMAMTVTSNYVRTLQAFSSCVALRDEQTGGHCNRVAYNAWKVGHNLGMGKTNLTHLYFAGILHDLGKISVPDGILLKPGKLTAEEYVTMQKHASFGAEILISISDDFRKIAEGVRGHHERWDGQGYPDKLKGKNIPIAARILGVSDVFEALTSKRPYREPLRAEEAMALIRKNSGTHFDPDLVMIFDDLFRRGQIITEEEEVPVIPIAYEPDLWMKVA